MEYIIQNSMEQNGDVWNTLEATVSYSTRARLTPTLTHIVAYELATSGAEDDAMSESGSIRGQNWLSASRNPLVTHDPN